MKRFRVARSRDWRIWNSRKGKWVTQLEGNYTTYVTHSRAIKAAQSLSFLFPDVVVELEGHP